MSKKYDEYEQDDYYLDDEIDENSEDYWLDDEEDYSEEDLDEYGYSEDISDDEKDSDYPDEMEETVDDTEEPDEEDESEGDYDSDDEVWEESDELLLDEEEDEKDPDKKGSKKIWVILGSVVGVLAAVYIVVSVFFMSHFYMNTEINGHNFSAKKVSDVETYMKTQVEKYTLTIHEKENRTDTISGKEIDLKYVDSNNIEKALKKQNAFLWPKAFFSKSSNQITVGVSYDKEKLKSKIEKLQSVNMEQIPPVSAHPKFDGDKFVVEPEVTGTAVDREMLDKKINQYITEFRPELDMEKEKCYALPPYTSKSKEVQTACDTMNQYLKASITYKMAEPVVVDKAVISNWLSVDDKMQAKFNEEAVKGWLTEFGDKYDTVGVARTITTPWGKTAEVSGGTYGWSIDEDTEFVALTNSIKNGEVIEKEPAYYQRAAVYGPQDWGTTYAEVDLSAQHMWYIVDGAVALETDVVTGQPIPEKETTAGVFSILEKELNKTLVGDIKPETGKPEYETLVSFWMRVTWSGIGFHDAGWQAAFGGTLYQIEGIGSHGCINMPYDKASALYNMMPEGTPVIVHY